MQARALATRRQILDAAVETLTTAGYAGATTLAVQRRAGVSRGTLQYHFPTRPELLTGALEHVLARVVEEFVEARRTDPVPASDLVGLMWEQWQGPALTAWLELAVAARTNEDLRKPMQRVMADFDDRVRAAFVQIIGSDNIPPGLNERAPFFIFAVLNGLAVARAYDYASNETEVLDILQRLVSHQLQAA